MRASERDRFKTARQHRHDLITEGTRLSASAIKRRLKEGNLNGRVARKKPLISVANAQARLNYDLSKRHCTANQWLKVMSSLTKVHLVFSLSVVKCMCGGDLVRSSNANALNILSNTEEKVSWSGAV